MPLKHGLTPVQLEALYEVLRGRAPASFMRLEYRAGLRDLTGLEMEASWGRPDAERPALEFTGTFRETLPLSLRKETLTVDLVVETSAGELRFRRFTGRIRRITPAPQGTEVMAASGGYWLDKVRFDDYPSYVDASPSEVVADCVARAGEAGVYEVRHAEIEHVAGPKVRREEFLANTPVDKLARPIAAAVEEGSLFFRDSPLNAPLCHRDRGPAEAEGTEWEYTVGVDTDPALWLPETEGDEFDAVLPFRREDDGTIYFPLEENGDPSTRSIKIAGSVAPEGASYEIEMSDESDTADDDVYQLSAEAAVRLIDGEAATTQTIKWIHPLLVDGDFTGWTEPFDEGDRVGTRHWLAKIENLKETHDLTQEMPMLMVKRREELEDSPTVSALPAGRVRGS